MVYPTTGLPVTVEIAPGAQLTADPGSWPWVNVTGSWRQTAGISIEEGRGDWGQAVDAGSCSLTFDNLAGHFSQYNPAGQWYGKLGRDTPLRVRLRRGEDSFGRTVAGGLGVADSGQTWTRSGGSTGDYSVVPGAARHSIASINVSRNSLLAVDLVDVTVTATVTVPVLAAGAPIFAGVAARWDESAGSTTDAYLCEMRLETNNTVGIQLRRRAPATGAFTNLLGPFTIEGLTHTAGKAYRVELRVVGDMVQGRAFDAAGPTPAGWHIEIPDPAGSIGPGTAGVRSFVGSGSTNTLPVVLSWSDFSINVDLFGGYVPAWVPRWDLTTADRWVEVTAKGALYRLQPSSSKPAKRSPMFRAYRTTALAYWPAEDGDGAEAAASAIAGHEPLTASTGALTFTEATGLFGSANNYGTDRLTNVAGVSMTAKLPQTVTAAAGDDWSATVGIQITDITKITGDVVALEVETPGGTFVRWQYVFSFTTFGTSLRAVRSDGTSVTVASWSSVTETFYPANFSVWQNGANISAGMRWNAKTSTWAASGSVAGTLAGPARVTVNPTRTSVTGSLPMPAGHVAVWAGHPIPPAEDVDDLYDSYPLASYGAYRSFDLEVAHERIRRLAGEDGLAIDVPAVDAAGGATRMPLQPIEAPLVLYRQAEEVDGGVLYERPFGLAYQPRVARYNQAPALILNAAGELAAPPVPDAQGQGYRNRITVSRPEGSSAVAEAPEVIAGTALVYDESTDLPVKYDSDLPGQAGWRLHLAGQDALRWPQLALNLAATPQLIDAWLNCRPGSRIQAINPPADVAGQDIDVILEGHTTKLGFKDWDVTANFSPAAPWDVATVGGEQRVCVAGATLAGAITATATTLQVASPAPWTIRAEAYPLDLRVGGERVTVGQFGAVLNENPWMTGGITRWTAFNGTIAYAPGVTRSGYASAQLTADGGTNPRVESLGQYAVTAGQVYLVGAWVMSPSGFASGARVMIQWGNPGYLTTFSAPAGATPAGVWVWLEGEGTAPVGATVGWPAARIETTTVPAGTVLHTTGMVLVPKSTYTSQPQTFTVAPSGRGRNGVQLAHAAGDVVDVWAPAIVPL